MAGGRLFDLNHPSGPAEDFEKRARNFKLRKIYRTMGKKLWYEDHYRELVKNIAQLHITKELNSLVYIFGEKAFPVALNKAGEVTIGAALYGEVIAFL